MQLQINPKFRRTNATFGWQCDVDIAITKDGKHVQKIAWYAHSTNKREAFEKALMGGLKRLDLTLEHTIQALTLKGIDLENPERAD
jgi:hypothetical protein